MSATRPIRRIGRPTLILSSCCVLLCATAVAAAAADPSPHRSSEPSRPQVLHFGVRFSPQNVIDVPPLQQHRGDFRAGDYTVFSDTLTDRRGHVVGTEGGTGVITKVDATGAQIDYVLTISIPGGQVAAQGLGSPDPHKHLGIVGGTGRFAGAAGEIDVIENGDETGSLTITFTQH
jgi:hypothetical protein